MGQFCVAAGCTVLLSEASLEFTQIVNCNYASVFDFNSDPQLGEQKPPWQQPCHPEVF